MLLLLQRSIYKTMSRQVGARKRQKYDVSVIEKVVPLIKKCNYPESSI